MFQEFSHLHFDTSFSSSDRFMKNDTNGKVANEKKMMWG